MTLHITWETHGQRKRRAVYLSDDLRFSLTCTATNVLQAKPGGGHHEAWRLIAGDRESGSSHITCMVMLDPHTINGPRTAFAEAIEGITSADHPLYQWMQEAGPELTEQLANDRTLAAMRAATDSRGYA